MAVLHFLLTMLFTSIVIAQSLLSKPIPRNAQTIRPKPFPIDGKRGFAFNDPELSSHFSQSGQVSRISWAYNWASDPYFPSGTYLADSYNLVLAYVPMLWSSQHDMTSVWDANVAAAVAGYATDSLLAFNEPDICCDGCGGSCMDVSIAVDNYRQWIQPYAGNLKLGSPAVSNGVGEGIGASWLQDFLGNCTGCQVDFIVLHWYGDVSNPQSFKDYIGGCWNQFQRRIWVTEFGVNSGSEQEIANFLSTILPWLDSQEYIERYAYFMARNTGTPYLLNPDNSMTAVGATFMSN